MSSSGWVNTTSVVRDVSEECRWVALSRAGDDRALRCLIERHRTRLIRVASNLLRDNHEAEDVAQEAFLKAFRELHRLREDAAFPGFIYRICVRLCMDRLRARRNEVGELEGSSPSEGSRIENKVLIEKVLKYLPYDLRTTLVLREVEQLSYEEISELLTIPIGTVRSRLHAAREKFRKVWEEVAVS